MVSRLYIQIAVLFLCAPLLMACDNKKEEDKAAAAAAAQAAGQVADYPQNLYWGDLHVHSRYSFDSYSFGNKILSPADAYRFARGEAITAHNGEQAQLKRPLDFLLVSDHAEYFGVLASLQDGVGNIGESELGKRWGGWTNDNQIRPILDEYMKSVATVSKPHGYPDDKIMNDIWQRHNAISEQYNEPGKFTALIGYEWTSMIDGNNLHRVVVFRGNAADVKDIVPFSALDSVDPESLWSALENYAQTSGKKVMAIPHNGNLSNGLMFNDTTIAGKPIDAAYAKRRMQWEPVYEMTQVKGDAEAHPLLSPFDPFADYENWDETSINMVHKPEALKAQMYLHEYARPALKRGLAYNQSLGANPFKFGMIGSTDSHTAFSTADDNNYYGKFPDSEPSPQRLTNKMGGSLWENRKLTASGYAGIWAAENTREALYDALERKEVYATTGPRIMLRFFAGWDYNDEDLKADDWARAAYHKGVPMGGDLHAPAQAGKTPQFLIMALRDPDGATLDRVQVVKGWVDAAGEIHEKVYNIAWAGARKMDAEGNIAAIADTVDVSTGKYDTRTGASMFAAHWQDPEFDAKQYAFYYVRVLEIPTPRWTTYDAIRYKQPIPNDVPATVQERAYSSPIWYNPTSE